MFPGYSGQEFLKTVQGNETGELGGQGSLMHVGSTGCLANRRAAAAQIAEKVDDGSDRKVSEQCITIY